MRRPAACLLLLLAASAPLRPAHAVAAPDGEVWHRAVRIETTLGADGLYESEQSWEVTAETPSAARVVAQQTFGWSAGLEQVEVAEAYTRKADGTVLPVAPEAVLAQAVGATVEFPSFSDWQIRTILFPEVAAGDTVHYVLRRRALAALFPGQYEAALRPGPRPNVTRADITLRAPAGLRLRAVPSGLVEDAPETEEGPDGARVTRRWHLDAAGRGGVVALDLSTFADYAALGAAYAARAAERSAPSPAVRDLAERLTAGVTDRREQARRLYEHVAQTIRYVGLQLGTGRVVPHPAEEVTRVGYGDCKDHVALLQALLAAKGIASVPALITVKSRYDLPDAPTLALLDHVILRVPELDLWLDSTSPYAPFGVLPFGEYDKPVVLADPVQPRLDRTPPLPSGLAGIEVRTEATLGADGTVSGQTETLATGPSSIALREVAAGIERNGAAWWAADQLRHLGTPGEGGFEFDTPLELGESYDLHASFRLEDRLAEGETGRFPLPAGLTVLVRAGAFLVSATPEEGGAHVCYAGRNAEEIRLRLPEGMEATLPHDVEVSGGFARYRARYTRENGAVVARREFSVTAPRPFCTAAEYEEMRPVIRAAHLDMRAEVEVSREE